MRVPKCDNPQCTRGSNGGVSVDVSPDEEWLIGALGLASEPAPAFFLDFCSAECAAQAFLLERSSEATVSQVEIPTPPIENVQ